MPRTYLFIYSFCKSRAFPILSVIINIFVLGNSVGRPNGMISSLTYVHSDYQSNIPSKFKKSVQRPQRRCDDQIITVLRKDHQVAVGSYLSVQQNWAAGGHICSETIRLQAQQDFEKLHHAVLVKTLYKYMLAEANPTVLHAEIPSEFRERTHFSTAFSANVSIVETLNIRHMTFKPVVAKINRFLKERPVRAMNTYTWMKNNSYGNVLVRLASFGW